jgi:hypothetical protein
MEKNNNNLSLNAKIFLMVFSCIFIIGSWFFIFKPVKERNDLKIDDLYKYSYNEDNPFEKPYIRYYKVIDIKDNYVLYIDTVDGDTMNMKIRSFLIGTEKLD